MPGLNIKETNESALARAGSEEMVGSNNNKKTRLAVGLLNMGFCCRK